MNGGLLTPDNVRLGHKFCNNRDFIWRQKINAMLAKGMSLDEIAAELNEQGADDPRHESVDAGRRSKGIRLVEARSATRGACGSGR